jgi:uncharacterized tellurite resistance protein B-like protein
MAVNLETMPVLQTELRQLLQKYELPAQEIERLIGKFEAEIEESIAFTEFVENLNTSSSQGAILIDPLAHMTDAEREAYFVERYQQLDSETREMLERTQGRWVNDDA